MRSEHCGNTPVEIAICGGGPVGLALALLLAARGVPGTRIAIIDAKPLEQATRDPRSIALSFGSTQILEQAGAWPVAAEAIHQIHVSRRGRFGRTLIDRREHGVPALGYVARYGDLVARLAAVAVNRHIHMLRPARVRASVEQDDRVQLTLEDGGSIEAAVMVQAEGGMFSDQHAKALHRDYEQTALIAHVQCSAPIAHRAYERFTDEGPLALLPQGDGYALVWCARPATAAKLQALTESAFLEQLGQVFGSRLGRFTAVGPRAAYPLGLNAQPAATARSVAIGNAAQTLHPVAGQGLNLGLRDAAVLARLLAQDASPRALAEFGRLRETDRGITIRLTDTMARIFARSPQDSPLQAILGLSLAAVDTVKPARRLLAEHMMFGQRK